MVDAVNSVTRVGDCVRVCARVCVCVGGGGGCARVCMCDSVHSVHSVWKRLRDRQTNRLTDRHYMGLQYKQMALKGLCECCV